MYSSTSTDHRALFAAHRLRYTRQRAALYSTLAATTSHPTAEQLFEMTRATITSTRGGATPQRSLSLSTVYSVLEAFVERGLCRRITNVRGVGPCRFDADVSEHVHVVMPDGSLRDVPEPIASRALATVMGAEPGSHGVIQDIEHAMGVRIGRASLQLIAHA